MPAAAGRNRGQFREQALIAAVLVAMPGALLIVAPDGVIRSCNRAANRLFGYGDSALAGESVEQLVHEVLDSGREVLGMTTKAMPGSAGTWAKKVSNASSPPAGGPIPTRYRNGSPCIVLYAADGATSPVSPPPFSKISPIY